MDSLFHRQYFGDVTVDKIKAPIIGVLGKIAERSFVYTLYSRWFSAIPPCHAIVLSNLRAQKHS